MSAASHDDLAFSTATELTSALQRREVSSQELLDVYLARLERFNGELNAIVTVDSEGARASAQAADDASARGDSLGPLHGLPMTIKDCFDVAGMRTTVGDPDYEQYVPAIDAPLVARLRAAGAVIFGRSNVPYRLKDLQTCNPVFGCTRNPWNVSVTPGGSGGGAGAAVSAGLTALDVSGDMGGSTRVPASHCGVFGLKPTYGIIPNLGVLPLPPGHRAEVDMESPGPMGRAIEDLELALDVMAGPRDDLARAWSLSLPPPRATRLADFRVGVWLDDLTYPTEGAVFDVLRHAADHLADAGARLDEISRPGSLEEVVDLFQQLFFANIGGSMSDADYAVAAGDSPVKATYRSWYKANERRAQLRHRWSQYFDEFDILLAPCCVVAAHANSDEPDIMKRTIKINNVESPYLNLMAWAAPANALHLPAVAVPAGLTADGLPVGLQIIAGYLEDRTALEAGRQISEAIGGYQRPPGY